MKQSPDPFTDQSVALYKAVFSREPSVLERYHRLECHAQPGVLSHVKTASNRLAGVAQAVFTLGRRLRIQRAPRVITQRWQAKGLKTCVLVILMLPFLQLALPAVMNSVASFVVRVLTPDAWVEGFYAKQQCAVRLPVVDASGPLLDVTDSVCGLPSGEPHFITSPMTQAEASRYARFIELLEGDHAVARNTLLGVDLKGIGRAVLGLLPSRTSVGGSNGLQTAIKNLDGNVDGSVMIEKVGYLAKTMLAAAYMDDDARDMFVALNLPPITTRNPTYGAPLAGGLVPFVFGETRVSDLSDGQLCLLAAALKRQLIVTGHDTTAAQQRSADRRNAGVKERAKTRCVDELGLPSAQVAQAYADIDTVQLTMSALGDEPRLGAPPRLRGMAPGARSFLSGVDERERRESPLLFSALSGETQRAFQQRLIDWGGDLTLRDATLCLPWLSCREGQRSVDMLAVVLEGEGAEQQMRLGYSTSELWKSNNRSLGSLPKILAGGMALAQGHASATFCRRRALGLHDGDFAGFDDCRDAGAQLSLEQLIGHSSNLAYVELIDALGGAERVAGYYDALGLHVEPRQAFPTRDDYRWALGVGTGVTGSPQNAVRAFTALVAAAEGKPPVAYQIEAMSPASHPIDLSNVISGDIGAIASHATQLQGALHEGGTLQALAPALEARGCSIERSFAKTGTTQAQNRDDRRRVRDRYILLSTECSGRRITAMTMIGSPNMASSIDGIRGADSRKLMLNALDAVLEK